MTALSLFYMNGTMVQAKTVNGKISAKTVKVGKRITVSSKTGGATFSSSNSVIASVDSTGAVTGKKAGTVKISVKKKGYKTKTFRIKVKKSAGKPAALPVTFSEISASKPDFYTGRMRIKNWSKKGAIKKIVYTYEVEWVSNSSCISEVPTATPTPTQTPVGDAKSASGSAVSDETTQVTPSPSATPANSSSNSFTTHTENVTFSWNTIVAPGKTAPTIASRYNDMGNRVHSYKLIKIELYTGKALYVYDAIKDTYTLKWGTKDITAPKFSGLLKKKSVSGDNGDAYRTYYSDKKNQYNFKQFVRAKDDRDSKVKIAVNTDKINWKKTGKYKIYYTAKDSSGNKTTTWAYVQVIVPGTAESAADQVLRSITKSGWSDERKARAIYRYVKGHLAYVHNAAHVQWRAAALKALRYQTGDCYTYYATCRLLLTRAGIPNVMIRRYPVPGGQRHFWNLTYVSGGWYHLDTTPRRRDARFCLWTDAQLHSYSSGYTFRFHASWYPARAKKRIA